MPEMTGWDFYQALVRTRPGLEKRAILMTGSSFGSFSEEARSFVEGFEDRRITKPFAIEQVRKLVDGILHSS